MINNRKIAYNYVVNDKQDKRKSNINILELKKIPGHVLSKSFIGEKYSVTEN